MPDLVSANWERAQFATGTLVGYRSYQVYPEHFAYRAASTACEAELGCFTPDERLIEYGSARALAHQAGHAILWHLDCSCWEAYEHRDILECECG